MASQISTGDIESHPEVEIEIANSCNCCWGRRVRKSKPKKEHDLTPVEEAFAHIISSPSHQSPKVRDINDVLSLKVEVDGTTSSPQGKHEKEET